MIDEAKGRTALITGASGGIGLEFAKLFARDGYNLVLVARNEAKLQAIKLDLEKRAGIKARVIAKDLNEPASPDEIYKELEELGLSVDVLVNNAGFGYTQ